MTKTDYFRVAYTLVLLCGLSGCLSTSEVPRTAMLETPTMVSESEDSSEPVEDQAQSDSYAEYQERNTGVLEGVSRPANVVEVSSPVGGIIAEVHVKEGERVKKGQALVSLDARVQAARLAAAEVDAASQGALIRAQVNQRVADLYLRRLHGAAPGSLRPAELEEAEGRLDEAKAAVQEQTEILAAAKASRDIAKAQLDEFTIVAPFDGTIVEIHHKSGLADPRVPILKIANLDHLEVEMYLPVDRYGSIECGETLTLDADAPIGRPLQAEVLSTSPLIDAASGTFRCLLKIENTELDLPAGFTVKLSGHKE